MQSPKDQNFKIPFKQALGYFSIVLVMFTYLYLSGHFDSDYYYHMQNFGNFNYPPFLSWILSPFKIQWIRSAMLFFYNILFAVALPFILIAHITKSWNAPVIYLLSGVPLLLFIIWVVPQSIITTLALVSIAFPPAIILMILLGPYIHEFWLPLLALVFVYWGFKYFEKFTKYLRLPYGT